MKEIAHIYTDFPTKFGLPRQSCRNGFAKGRIVFEKEYRDVNAFRGLEDYSDLWIIWKFSENEEAGWSPTVRPPKLGGNRRMGVFATRSPFRPNPIGLSRVTLDKISYEEEGPVLYVSGIDMVNGTPIIDIKPYIVYADSNPEAKSGFTESLGLTDKIPSLEEYTGPDFIEGDLLKELLEALAQDPRPGYQNDSQRIYGFSFADYEIRFRCDEKYVYLIQSHKITNSG